MIVGSEIVKVVKEADVVFPVVNELVMIVLEGVIDFDENDGLLLGVVELEGRDRLLKSVTDFDEVDGLLMGVVKLEEIDELLKGVIDSDEVAGLLRGLVDRVKDEMLSGVVNNDEVDILVVEVLVLVKVLFETTIVLLIGGGMLIDEVEELI